MDLPKGKKNKQESPEQIKIPGPWKKWQLVPLQGVNSPSLKHHLWESEGAANATHPMKQGPNKALLRATMINSPLKRPSFLGVVAGVPLDSGSLKDLGGLGLCRFFFLAEGTLWEDVRKNSVFRGLRQRAFWADVGNKKVRMKNVETFDRTKFSKSLGVLSGFCLGGY